MAQLFIWFMLYSFVGWSYETTLYSIKNKKFVDSGMMYGCYCPIYGLGGLVIVLFFSGIDNPAMIFAGAMMVCCTLEYFASWVIERIYGARWWDYSDWPMNLGGRVCLFAGLAFGTMAVLTVRYLHPAVVELTGLFPQSWLNVTAVLLLAVFIVDIIATARRYSKMKPDNDQVNIVLKLPFDFMPRFPQLGSRMRGLASAVMDNSPLDFIREKLEEIFNDHT